MQLQSNEGNKKEEVNMKIYLRDLRLVTEEIETSLKEKGFNVEIKPYFAYGAYSYRFLFYNKDDSFKISLETELGTKKECFERLSTCYYKTLAFKDEYLPL